jgi:hypothetical protein
MLVIDKLGNQHNIQFLPKYSTKQFTDGQVAIKAYSLNESGTAAFYTKTITSMWLPVETEWFMRKQEYPACHIM